MMVLPFAGAKKIEDNRQKLKAVGGPTRVAFIQSRPVFVCALVTNGPEVEQEWLAA